MDDAQLRTLALAMREQYLPGIVARRAPWDAEGANDALGHAAWLLDRLASGDKLAPTLADAKQRWLGFAQGLIWSHADISLTEIVQATKFASKG